MTCLFAARVCVVLAAGAQWAHGQAARTAAARQPVALIEMEGMVEVSLAGRPVWDRVFTNQIPLQLFAGDRVRTRERSRAVVRLSDLTPLRLDALTFFRVPADPKSRNVLELLRGVIYLFHRDQPGVFPIGTPTWSATVRGTEFNVEVAEDGRSVLTLLDGEVDIVSPDGELQLKSGEAAVIEPGKAPRRRAVLDAVNVVQWALYYPGVLDVEELNGLNKLNGLKESLAAYRAGDLLQALELYPVERQPASDAERVYLAAMLLGVGQVQQAEELLTAVEKQDGSQERLAGALRKVIASVQGRTLLATNDGQGARPTLATELLAESYYQQSRRNLEAARDAARRAVEVSPDFGFGWARLAELEFGFGQIGPALRTVNKSLLLAPRNAEALAVKGFLLAAQNKMTEARSLFDEAILVDGALGNAWLGRGLVRIRSGDTHGGREDLQTAALLEPRRALLRSYLGKAFANAGSYALAAKELRLAKEFDANDPTAWLYSALLKHQENRINEAVEDLEKSRDLNENRGVYRSQLLLDQDRAVRAVNLAAIYDDAGFSDVSLWEASGAVSADYANFSAHLFLADSYQRHRDLRGVDLRYETPAVNEYLVASLLAPVGAGALAHSVSQQEYSKLFESDGFGLASSTEYLSRGAWTQSGAQYGNFGNFGYAASAFYRFDPGQRRHNNIEQTEYSIQLQQQITPSDTAYLRAIASYAEGGDLARYYNPDDSGETRGFKERQEPLLLLGHHHEWSPGVHTLFLGGRLHDSFRATNASQPALLVGRNPNGSVDAVLPIGAEQDYRNDLEIYTAELQQIWQQRRHTLILGGRYQTGEFLTENQHTNFTGVLVPFLFPQDRQESSSDFERLSLYAYHNWQVLDPLQLTAGVSYDRLTFPENFRFAPLLEEEDRTTRVSPKAGLIWIPGRNTQFRFAYSQSLGGASFDQSFRLEPIHVAGINQTYRSLIPESVAGANSAARFETFGALLEHRIAQKTYLGFGGEILESKVDRTLGVYEFTPPFVIERSGTRERLDFIERSVFVSLNQLIADEWSFGARYRFSQAELEDSFRNIDSSATLARGFRREQELEAVLHEVRGYGIFNHPSGFFSQAEAIWRGQNSQGYASDLESEDIWQFNVFAGYRFARRHAEARIGLLNVMDQDYRLNPLNLTGDLPRERTLMVTLRFYF